MVMRHDTSFLAYGWTGDGNASGTIPKHNHGVYEDLDLATKEHTAFTP